MKNVFDKYPHKREMQFFKDISDEFGKVGLYCFIGGVVFQSDPARGAGAGLCMLALVVLVMGWAVTKIPVTRWEKRRFEAGVAKVQEEARQRYMAEAAEDRERLKAYADSFLGRRPSDDHEPKH